MTTVRELIDTYRARLMAASDMHADEASTILVQLSAIIGNVTEEIVNRQMTYNRLLNDLVSTPDMTAAKARIRAEASEEYEALLRVEKSQMVVTDMIRALKYRLRVLSDEKQSSSNQ